MKAGQSSSIPATAQAIWRFSADQRFPSCLAHISRVKQGIAPELLSNGWIEQRRVQSRHITQDRVLYLLQKVLHILKEVKKKSKHLKSGKETQVYKVYKQLFTASNGIGVATGSTERSSGGWNWGCLPSFHPSLSRPLIPFVHLNVKFSLPFLQSFLVLR